MATASKKRKGQQRQAAIRLVILAAILVGVNMIASRFHAGLDLTKEKRFTLSDPTKRMLRDMDGVAVVTVYLTGNKLPAEWKRLKEATLEKLSTLKDYGGNKIVFRFEDPFEDKTDQEQGEIYKQLYDKGIYFVPVQMGTNQSVTEQKVFPFALVNYKGREMSVNLIENHSGMESHGVLNYSESLLEYKFASAIQKLSLPDKPRVAYIVGHGEPLNVETIDMLERTLPKYYHVDTIDLPSTYYIPSAEDVIIINKPTQPFDDKDKFKIDQYVMNGGHVLWAIDKLNVPMDTFQNSSQYLAMAYDLNLDDILFKWGVRINADLIEDKQCLTIPGVTQTRDQQGQGQAILREWPLLPIFSPSSHHPVVNNMDNIKGIMASSIDTIATPGITKTILLESSKYSRTTPSPVRINLAMIMQGVPPQYELFNKPYQPVAVLMQGKFTSTFVNRLPVSVLRILDSIHHPFKAQADADGSMIVVADGDMFLNRIGRSGPMDMGRWQYAQTPEKYANKSFFLNCIEYLTDNSGLLEARSKSARLRLLDPDRVGKEKLMWQIVNILLPIASVLIFAMVFLFFRKRKYEKKEN